MIKKPDNLYASPLDKIVDFRFDEQVVDVFPDMIQRSVPGYALMIATTGVLAGKYAKHQSYCYDLGCSLGAVSLAMRQHITASECTIVAIDNSSAMIQRARQHLKSDHEKAAGIQLVCADVRDIKIENASVVVMNLTLQFIPPDERLALIEGIFTGLMPGGVLILSEKIACEEPREQKLHQELHEEFKRAQGYSDLEISQKRAALEKVMLPETMRVHQRRLREAGFVDVAVWFQCLNFASMIAIK